MEEKLYKFTNRWGNTYDIKINVEHYCDPGGYAIEMICRDEEYDDDYWEPYAIMTVNLRPFDPYDVEQDEEDIVCLDTNNLGEGILDWAYDNDIIEGDVIAWVRSGFCQYPAVHLSQTFLDEYA